LAVKTVSSMYSPVLSAVGVDAQPTMAASISAESKAGTDCRVLIVCSL
jgi:hypothetical protein